MKCIRMSRACQRSTRALVFRPGPSKYVRVSRTTRSRSSSVVAIGSSPFNSKCAPQPAGPQPRDGWQRALRGLLEKAIDVVGRDQVRHGPAVDVVLGHALLGEAAELRGPAAVLRHLPRDE